MQDTVISKLFCYFVLIHANVQTRFNPATGDMPPYYRIKESFRDVQGHIHSLILLNIGFEPLLTAVQVRKIACALTERFKIGRHFHPSDNGHAERTKQKARSQMGTGFYVCLE